MDSPNFDHNSDNHDDDAPWGISVSVSAMNSSEVKARRNGLYLERRTLRQEEKALRAVLKRAREQQTQLQVEALELQARLRGQGRGQQREGWGPAQQPKSEARARVRRNSVSEQMRATQGRMVSSAATSVLSSSSVQGGTTGAALVGSQDPFAPSPAEGDVNAGELDLGVDHQAILEKMMRGQFIPNQEEEEDDSD